MPTLPSSLALTVINDNAPIIASDHRNNNSAIQTDVNALIVALAGGAAGQALIATDATNVAYKYPPGYEVTYDQFTASVTGIVAVTDATAATVKATTSQTYENVPYIIEFFAPVVINNTNGQTTYLTLYYDATALGIIGRFDFTTANLGSPALLRFRHTPTAGAHVYTVKSFVSAGSGSVIAGAGGSGVAAPGYVRVTKA